MAHDGRRMALRLVAAWLLLPAACAFCAPASRRASGRALRAGTSARLSATALTTLQRLTEEYDAFLLDQFGVIHDGKTAYDGAVEAVRSVQRAGKKIVIISNSSRRRGDTIAKLVRMGFGPCEGEDGGLVGECEEGLPPITVITSGDLVFKGLEAGDSAPFADLGIRCLVFGNGEDDEDYVRECGRVASPVGQADFVLARGLFSILGAGRDLLIDPAAEYTAEAEAALLGEAMARAPGGLPLLVANVSGAGLPTHAPRAARALHE